MHDMYMTLYVSAYYSDCDYIIIIIKCYSNQLSSTLKRKGPKSIQIEDAVDSSAVNLAHNYSATWDSSLSAKLRIIKEIFVVDGYLYLSSLC